jgi:EAL domain-containing protein (putative c-di-GMP-specific phosphodiesterase class I)
VHSADLAAGEVLLRDADVAMYVAKESGKDCVRLFETSMHGRLLARLELEAGLRTAVRNGELRLHYQPTIDLETGACLGMEALLRWERPGQGTVQPGDFIPLAEATGLIVPIGEWVLEAACRQLALWQAQPGCEELHVNVNLSPRQLADPEVAQHVAHALAVSGIAPHSLVLEITEGALVSDPEDAARTLEQIKALGVRLALDDFGTGYSALGYLHRFPIDILKIDRSFVSSLHQSAHDPALVRAVIGLGSALGLEVVAEGIEQEQHAAILRRLNCPTGQGFLYGRPMAVDDMATWMTQHPLVGRVPAPRSPERAELVRLAEQP